MAASGRLPSSTVEVVPSRAAAISAFPGISFLCLRPAGLVTLLRGDDDDDLVAVVAHVGGW